jgi:Ca2+-binding EF-hand superfamily protein
MKNISLKKLSITVVVASLASNLVFANNDMGKALAKVEQPMSSFSQLITDYDTDKNNTLSAKELAKNEKLTKVFAQLDANGDKEVSEQEFNQFLSKMKKSLT